MPSLEVIMIVGKWSSPKGQACDIDAYLWKNPNPIYKLRVRWSSPERVRKDAGQEEKKKKKMS